MSELTPRPSMPPQQASATYDGDTMLIQLPARQPQPHRSSSMPLQDFMDFVWAARWTMVWSVLSFLSLGVFYVWQAKRIYQADAMIQVEARQRTGNPGLAALTQGAYDSSAEAQAEVEILQSNLVLGRVVEALKLDVVVTPKYIPVVGRPLMRGRPNAPEAEVEFFEVPPAMLGGEFHLIIGDGNAYTLATATGQSLFQGRVGEEAQGDFLGQAIKIKLRKLTGKPGQRFLLIRQPFLQAVRSLRDRLRVGEKGRQTNIIGLSLQDSDPYRCAMILDGVLDQYIRQNVGHKAEETTKTLDFLQNQLPQLKAKLEAAEEKLNAYRSGTRSVDMGENTRIALQQSASLESQAVALRQKREELLRSYQENSEVVRALDKQIQSLQEESRKLEGQVRGLPRTQQETLRLMLEVQVNKELYTSLLNNTQQLQVAQASAIGNARILDRATPGLKPLKPAIPFSLLVFTIMGAIIGAAITLIRHALRASVQDPRALASELGLPILVTIPHSDFQERTSRKGEPEGILAVTSPNDMAVESLRSLRTSLHFMMVDAPNRAIMIAGSAPGIGKSFTNLNFAAVTAMSGVRVLLVDADLRNGQLHKSIGLAEPGTGLTEVLTGAAPWKNALQPAHETIPTLDFLSTGTPPPHPAELLMSSRFDTFLAEACEVYDFVIIDAPPIMAVTDAAVIGARVGTVLFLVKDSAHEPEELHFALGRLQSAQVRLVGVVYNDILPESPSGYRHRPYHYGYPRA